MIKITEYERAQLKAVYINLPHEDEWHFRNRYMSVGFPCVGGRRGDWIDSIPTEKIRDAIAFAVECMDRIIDGAAVFDGSEYKAYLATGESFGCVNHEERNE